MVKSQEYVLLGRSLGESIQGRSHVKYTDYVVVSCCFNDLVNLSWTTREIVTKLTSKAYFSNGLGKTTSTGR